MNIKTDWHRGGFLRERWFSLAKLVFLLSIGMLIARRISNVVPLDLPVLFLALSFAMYLASEKIDGRVIPIQEKAFCYFGIYALFFTNAGRYLWRMLESKSTVAWFTLALLVVIAAIISYQCHYFRRQAKKQAESKWVLISGITAIIYMSSVPIRFFIEILF